MDTVVNSKYIITLDVQVSDFCKVGFLRFFKSVFSLRVYDVTYQKKALAPMTSVMIS